MSDSQQSPMTVYEHMFEVTLTVLVPVLSGDRSRTKVSRDAIMARLAEIVGGWNAMEADSHVEGAIDYLESRLMALTPEQARARAGLISASDYFDSDEEEGRGHDH